MTSSHCRSLGQDAKKKELEILVSLKFTGSVVTQDKECEGLRMARNASIAELDGDGFSLWKRNPHQPATGGVTWHLGLQPRPGLSVLKG